MVATLLRPLTSGLQDERLKYNTQPSIRGFHKVFVRAGRMTTQWVRLDFNQLPDFGRTATVDLIRKGHFITRLFLVSTLPDIATVQTAAALAANGQEVAPKFCYTNAAGHALIANADMTISGTIVDVLDGRLLEHIDEFNTPLEKVPAVNRLIARNDSNFAVTNGLGYVDPVPTVRVPLLFWFARGDSGCALPIDAMGSDLVQLRITFRGLNGMYYTDSRTQATPDPLIDGSALWPLTSSQLYVRDASGTVIPGLIPSDPTATVSPLAGFTMPPATQLQLGETYILAEYVYVDRPEANKFRLADLQIPVLQHYRIEPFDTQAIPNANIPIRVPNPARALFMYPQRYEAASYNAHFLATRDLSGAGVPYAPWWPNSVGLGALTVPSKFIPGFALRDSEPIQALSFVYEGNYTRWATQHPSLFRSGIVGTIFPKTPWVNRYLYTLPFGLSPVPTLPVGEANLDKLRRAELRLEFSPQRGCLNPMQVPRFWIYCYVENYNILRVYGGRGAMLFSY